jgi:hypothetical protein
VKLMRSVRRNVQRVAGAHARLLAAEGRFHLTFEQDKGLLEVMPMRRRSATWRDVHVDDAEASVGLLARHGDGVGIADETDVREVIGLRQRETAFAVVRRYTRTDITLRSVRSPRPDKAAAAGRRPRHQGQPPTSHPPGGRLLPSDRPFQQETYCGS